MDNPGFRRKVFRTVDTELCGSEHFVAGITVFPQGEASSLHSHPESEEINVILSGHGEVVGADGSRQPFGPHDMMFLPKGLPHQHVNTGSEPLVLLREGDEIRAIHATCAHAGGPLHEGTLIDGCVECPWHGSRFRLADGHVVRGPAVYDQPAYEVRRTPDGGLEARAAGRE